MAELPSLSLTAEEADRMGLDSYQFGLVQDLIAQRVRAALNLSISHLEETGPDPEELKACLLYLRRSLDPLGTLPDLALASPIESRDSARCKDVFSEASESGRFRACAGCGGKTTHTNVVAQMGPYTEYDNVLIVDVSGGYSMFFDNYEAGNFTLVLCHTCAHEACNRLPWLARLLDPQRSHTHTGYSQAMHPSHYGSDYERNA